MVLLNYLHLPNDALARLRGGEISLVGHTPYEGPIGRGGG